MSHPVVSIIIPCYNDGDVLPRAIDSVLSQTFTDFELIIIDDASTDNTEKVLNRYDEDKIIVPQHEVNKGGAAARNTGIDAASGTYIAFLDADDEWHNKKLELQVGMMESTGQEYVASYCDAVVKISPMWDRLRKLYKRYISSPEITGVEGGEELVNEVLLLNFSIGGSSTLIVKKETVTEINGFDESFRRHQDLEFLIRVLKQGKLAFLDEEMVTKYDAGRPSSDIVEKERLRFLQKFSDKVFELEMEGHNVIDQHLLNVSIVLFFNSEFKRGLSNIINLNIVDRRNFPRIVWGIIMGAHNSLR